MLSKHGAQCQKAIIAWGDDDHLRQLKADVPIYYYGLNKNDDIYADNIQITDKGTQFDVYVNGEYYDQFYHLSTVIIISKMH